MLPLSTMSKKIISHPDLPKVIGVGFQKTGTSTLRDALRILGYRVKDTTPRALFPILRKNYNKIDRILTGYNAMEDTPWFKFYKELDQMYPGSKFILTIRDEESWYKSVAKHIGSLRAAHHEWIYGKGKSLPKDHKENTIRVYSEHNAEVLEYFKDRPDDLLVIDFTKGDGWDKLCPFLAKDIPAAVLPHANKTAEGEKVKTTTKYKLRILRHRIKNELKIALLSSFGWLK